MSSTARPAAASRLPWLVVLLGIAGLLLLITSDRLRQHRLERHLKRVSAIEQVQLDIALSHLWIEEYLTGDLVEIPDIFDPIARAQVLVDELLGNEPPRAGRKVAPLTPLATSPQLLQANQLHQRLAELNRISHRRMDGHAAGRAVGSGSVTDVVYDGIFAGVLDSARQLEGLLQTEMVQFRHLSKRIFLIAVALWSTLIVSTAITLHRRELRRTRAEADLAESRRTVQRAQKMDAVGRMAGGLAHDLNNYLAAVRGHCELARMKLKNQDPASHKLDDAVRVIGKAAKLIERLLTFSYSEPAAPEVVNPNRAVYSVERIFRPTISETLHLETRLAPDLWNVKIDADGLQQALLNLLLNARDAMPDGGTVVMETRNLPQWRTTDGVSIAVIDPGTGIAPEIRDSLFEPFLTTKAHSGGFGLGLSMVSQIIEQAGGIIVVHSEVGQGSTFDIQLPRCSLPETVSPSEMKAIGVDLRGHERILLVDDNAEYRQSLEALLRGLGYRVTCAVDGLAALDACEASDFAFDLILADVVMPDLGGLELIERIRQRKPIQALLLSARGRLECESLGVNIDEDHFLHKLVSPLELAARMRALLEGDEEL